MTRNLIFASALAILALATPASAQVTIDMSEISCKDFAAYDDDTKDFIDSWMRGFFLSKKNITTIDSRYVKRNTAKVLRYCKKLPKTSLMDAI